jgi:2-polyprenyl-6-methoxyphenol hydroxylase-like FAD-dependent oxidoreductase
MTIQWCQSVSIANSTEVKRRFEIDQISSCHFQIQAFWTDMAVEHETPVLVVGGGPAGLILSLQLARNGTNCMLVERNENTTKWPKMDLTNCRSMELLKRLNICEGLREIGVPQHFAFNVLFSTGLSDGGKLVAKWDLDSTDQWRRRIKEQNDGSMPAEPYQRCSQALFEAWLKPKIQAEPLIDSYFGMKFESLEETEEGVLSLLIDQNTGEKHVVRSTYIVGTDGAGSRVRKEISGALIGGPVPAAMYLVHFKSRDLTRLQRQGQFWHIFFTHGAIIIAQDEVDTWTSHYPVSLDTNVDELDPVETVYKVLGGSGTPYPIEIDEVLVTSSWRPNICVVDRYRSSRGRVFLSGDSAHQNIPTGGYGMNTAVGDSFDIGWKLSAVLTGWAGQYLLDSYELERKPVALRNIEHSGVHWKVHADYWGWVREGEQGLVTAKTAEGDEFRKRIAAHVTELDGENKDQGIELGYRCNGSPVVVPDNEEDEPRWEKRFYVPSTWPGVRAPHIYLRDGKTSIFDLFGSSYTLVDFTSRGGFVDMFEKSAARLNIPLKTVHLPDEPHARQVWERDAVLVRPDDHISWRASMDGNHNVQAEQVLLIAVGKVSALAGSETGTEVRATASALDHKGFTGTIGNVDQSKVKMLADFQK